MISPPDDRRPPITPQLAMRVAVLGGVALVLFGLIFFRLWFLQVLSGEQYLAEARDNRVRSIRVQAPRGDIVDRHGQTMVDSRPATVIQLEPQKLPEAVRRQADRYRARLSAAERERVRRDRKRARAVPVPPLPASERATAELYRRLARVLDMSPKRIHAEVLRQVGLAPYANVTVKTDVPHTKFAYILERQEQFPGVIVDDKYLRSYPERELAAQIFGTVGEISPAELEQERYQGVPQGTIVGKGGVEEEYDQYLRGEDGATRVQVDANGEPNGRPLGSKDPVRGRQLKLSIDLDLQKAGQEALTLGRGLANRNGNPAPAAAFVAMDPRNGELLGLGSSPSFDPNILVKPITQQRYQTLFGEAAGAPLFNRAVQGLYPTGSTFKVVTATAALESGLITPGTTISDPGKIRIGNQVFQNAGAQAYGAVDLRRAIQVSSDVYFYTLGRDMNGMKGQVLQSWAKKLGIGRKTGVDLPEEFKGLVPDRKWRARITKRELACRKRLDVPICRYDGRPWSVGDNVNLSVGQGDLQASPLQMAVAYAAIANGGRVVKPHLGLQVEDSQGEVLQEIEPGSARRVDISAGTLSAIRDGLKLAASAGGGTSADVFKDWPHDQYPVYGKTGTAETFTPDGAFDQSWYVAYVPHKTRPIVVAATIERGGFGAEAAAPAVRLILSQWFNQAKKVVEGSSRTN